MNRNQQRMALAEKAVVAVVAAAAEAAVRTPRMMPKPLPIR